MRLSESQRCPLCGSARGQARLFLRTVDVARCPECETHFVTAVHLPEPSDDDYAARYHAESRTGKPAACWDLFTKAAASCRTGRVLDVGCGSGGFLDLARAAGWATAGVDIAVAAVRAAEAAGHEAWALSATSLGQLPADTYDALTLWDVIEHTREPRRALTGAHRVLRPGGRIVILTPRMGSVYDRAGLLMNRVTLGRSDILLQMCWSSIHLLRLQGDGLARVLGDLGFRDVEVTPVQVLSLSSTHYAGSSIMPAWSQSAALNRLISRAGVAISRTLGLANKMLVTAQKAG